MGRFSVRQTAGGFKFDLKAPNGETIATSEVYSSRAACEKAIRALSKCAPDARIQDLTQADPPVSNPKFELYMDRAGAYRFRLRSRNGKILIFSESYTTRAACENGIDSVRKNAAQERSESHP